MNRNRPESLIRQGGGRTKSLMVLILGAFGKQHIHLMSSQCPFVHLPSGNSVKCAWFLWTILYMMHVLKTVLNNFNFCYLWFILRTGSCYSIRQELTAREFFNTNLHGTFLGLMQEYYRYVTFIQFNSFGNFFISGLIMLRHKREKNTL